MRNGVRMSTLLILAAFVLVASVASAQMEPTKLLRLPAISDDHLAFYYAGDLWIADRDGSNPSRLTVHEGIEGSPYFSPDGQWIAFSAEYDGNWDAYIIDVNGGAPVRLTYHPEGDVVRGWTPDGDVIFMSTRESETRRYGKLFTVSTDGGWPEAMVLPRASRACMSPDGSQIAYTMVGDPFSTWKRYRGGLSPWVWIFDFETMDVVEVPRETYTDPVTGGTTYANDTYPVWLGNTVYFLSDRDHTMNVFSYNTTTAAVEQLTDHQDYDIKSLKGFGTSLVYEQAGGIHVLDTNTGRSNEVDIYINPDLPDTRPHFVNVGGDAGWYEISPTGMRGVFSARGDIWTVPAENGDVRNITNTPDIHERYPIWSPDGGQVAYLSDASGEYRLHIKDQMGKEDPEIYKLGPDNFYFLISWDPDGERILYTDNLRSLFYYDVEAKKIVKVAEDMFGRWGFNPSWSPDGRYIGFTTNLSNRFGVVKIYDTESKDTYQVTDGMSEVSNATFSRDGKYLYFLSSTNVGLRINGSEMSSYGRESTDDMYLVVLQEDEASPFAPESDEEEVEVDEEDAEDEDDDAEDEDDAEDSEDEEDEGMPEIDFAGIDQRILAVPVDEGNFYNLRSAEGGYLFYMDASGDDPVLQRFSMDDEEASEFMSGVYGFEVSSDGNKVILSTGGSYSIVEAAGSPGPGDGSLDMSGMQIRVDPRAEWEQILREVWRLERDFFYDKNMHGVNWDAAYKKYQPFVKHAGHRDDINYLIGELIGELVVGHAYRWGGDMPSADRVNVGLLGAEYERENGLYRFAKIFSGQNWNPDERSPLTEPGINVQEGDYLLAVNGLEVTANDNLFEYFQNTAGRQTTLTVNDTPTMKDSREVIVEPLRSERGIRLRDWVEGNRQKVWEATDGRAAYVYMPNTAGAGYEFFTRYFFSQLDKDGVIIDERFNGGGHIADFVVDMLDRPLVNFWTNRSGSFDVSPTATILGPKVMIVNESAGSGGDWLPYAFKKRELGTIVGTRTWGGLVGIGGMPQLLDGGGVTVPNWAFFNADGSWGVENYGVAPDVEVYQTPKDVIAGNDPQLDKAIQVINQQLEGFVAPKPDPDPRPKRANR
jgi:tricorn protease